MFQSSEKWNAVYLRHAGDEALRDAYLEPEQTEAKCRTWLDADHCVQGSQRLKLS